MSPNLVVVVIKSFCWNTVYNFITKFRVWEKFRQMRNKVLDVRKNVEIPGKLSTL